MSEYRLDKTKFKMMTFKEADAADVFDKTTPYAERSPGTLSYLPGIWICFKRGTKA